MIANTAPVGTIFNKGQNLEIPFFQRSYVWGDEQWMRFLEDMKMISQNGRPYFLGSVILKRQIEKRDPQTGGILDTTHTVIDGQQRLTTLNIFFKVLFLKFGQDQIFTETFKKWRDKSIILVHNQNDIESFNRIVNLEIMEEIADMENNHIIGAYNFFRKNISIEDIESGSLNFSTLLSNIVFVGINLDPNEDEQQIFDTINSLGVRLTTAELLKNHFFNRDQMDLFQKYWRPTFEGDTDIRQYWDQELTTGRFTRSMIDIFFYAFLQIQVQNPELSVNTADKIDFSRLENLFESYKKFQKKYYKGSNIDLLTEIQEYATIFYKNIQPYAAKETIEKNAGINRINVIMFGLETTTLIPYALYILKNLQDEEQKSQLFDIIESYVMRRIITNQTPKNYNQLFTDRFIGNSVLSREQFISYINEKDDGVNLFPNDDLLFGGFYDNILVNKQTAGILYFIESKIRDPFHSMALLGFDSYSLEHLMPKKWRNNWKHSLNQEQAKERDQKLLTLGNLTIITQSLNASMRDADWETKKNGKGNKYGLLQYASGMDTLPQEFLHSQEWSEQTIAERANFLYEQAKQIWKNF